MPKILKYRIVLSGKAERDIKKLDKPVRERVVKAVKNLSLVRYPQQFKPLVGSKIAQCRLRVGDYRVLYDVYDQDGAVLVIRVGHRRDIYR